MEKYYFKRDPVQCGHVNKSIFKKISSQFSTEIIYNLEISVYLLR